MYDAVKLIHLVAAIVWIGGMTFMLIALRPAASAMLEAQSRARLMGQVWQRFFLLVMISIVALFTTGTNLYTLPSGPSKRPLAREACRWAGT